MSDLVWLGEKEYDPATGAGSIGVEFAGTAVSSSGFGGTIASANKKSAGVVRDSPELMWSEGYYRGYYELHVKKDEVRAEYYGKSDQKNFLQCLGSETSPLCGIVFINADYE